MAGGAVAEAEEERPLGELTTMVPDGLRLGDGWANMGWMLPDPFLGRVYCPLLEEVDNESVSFVPSFSVEVESESTGDFDSLLL